MAVHVIHRVDSSRRLSRAARDRDQAAFLAEAAKNGFTPGTSVQIAFEPAQDYGEPLGIAPDDEMCVRDRVLRAEGVPVQLAVSRLDRALTRGSALERADTGPGGMYARLAERGHPITRFEESVTAGPAHGHERALLGADVDTVLRIRRLAHSGERVVEINNMVLSARHYELHYPFSAE